MRPDDAFYRRLKREKQLNGLLFGLLAGLALAIAFWGIEAVLLARASMVFPWLKFLIGAPVVILVSGFAGWLTTRLDNSILGFLIWLVTGIFIVWVAGHVPFEGMTVAIQVLLPHFASLDVYPFVESARMRIGLLYVVVGGLIGLAGVLQPFFVEGATRASGQFQRLMTLMGCFLVFIPIGLLADNLINQPLRTPLLVIDQLIRDGRRALIEPVSKDKARQLSLSALRTFGTAIDQPYQLMLGKYDPQDMSETSVYLKLGDEWASCFVVINTPMYCQWSKDLYVKRMACLLKAENTSGCQMKLDPGVETQLAEVIENLGSAPYIDVLDQRGTVILMTLTGKNQQQYQCVLRHEGNIYVQSCTPTSGLPYRVVTATPTATATAPVTAAPVLAATPTPSALLLPERLPVSPTLEDAPRYDMELDIDYAAHTFSGKAAVEYVNQETTALESLYFRLIPNGQGSYGNGSLTVTQTLLDEQPVETRLTQSETVLEILLPKALEPGEAVQVAFDFQGIVPQDFGGDETPAGYGVYNFTDSVLALANWYPILAVYDQTGWNLDPVSEIGDSVFSDAAYYSVTVRVPEDVIVAATGSQTSSQMEDGIVISQYESGPARDFFLVMSQNYEVQSRTEGDTLVNVYYLPEHKRGADNALNAAVDSLRIFNQKFGPYPYTELDVVDAPMRNASGVEFPGIFMVKSDLFAEPDNPAFVTTTAHEVAHQWWYNVVGNDVFEEPWLDEALATYSSGMYWEFGPARIKPTPLIGYWQERYDSLRQDGLDDVITHSLAYFEDLQNPKVYGGIVYVKGALFLDALRQEIGDQAFFSALQAYYSDHPFDIAASEELLAAFETAAGRSLDDFFKKWLFSND